MKKSSTIDFHRSIATIFSIPTFKGIFKDGYSDYVVNKIATYRSMLGGRKDAKIQTLIKKAFQHLTLNYRVEYVYKNEIANQLLLKLHDLSEANILNEFRIGGSIADIVIINGTNTVYEIKTELDSREKLNKQLSDYRRVSPKVYLVTHHSLLERYIDYIDDESIGLITLSDRNELIVIREALSRIGRLDNKLMMDTLRKEEYSGILLSAFGFVPQVSNIQYFKECQKMACQLDPAYFHQLMLAQLRLRSIKERQLITSPNTPLELKHICLSFNPNKTEFQNLYQFLNLTI